MSKVERSRKKKPRGCFAYCRQCHLYHPVITEEGSSKTSGSPCGVHGLDAPNIYYRVYCPKSVYPKSTDWKRGGYNPMTDPFFKPV